MDKQVILNFKLLETAKLSVNEFLCLLKIYFSNDNINIDYDDLYLQYQSLENKKYIKIIVETIRNEKKIKYTLREKAKLIIEASFNDTLEVSIEKSKKKVTLSERTITRTVDHHLDDYRNLFKGLKLGAMGAPNSCRDKLKRWLKENPEYSFDHILKATAIYINSLNGNYAYLQQADYFIYKKQGKDEISKLSAFIDEIDSDLIENDGWTSTLS
jgi:hypothetical protein